MLKDEFDSTRMGRPKAVCGCGFGATSIHSSDPPSRCNPAPHCAFSDVPTTQQHPFLSHPQHLTPVQNPIHDEEGHIRNLAGSEALQKLKELGSSVCMFTTFTVNRPAPSRPMSVQCVEDDGSFYFFSAASSNKNRELAADGTAQLYFGNVMASEYLSVYGRATVTQDRALIAKYWREDVKIWFQGGKDDPDLTLIQVRPDAVHYWDTKHNQMVALLKMAAAYVTGKTMDDGVEGELRV